MFKRFKKRIKRKLKERRERIVLMDFFNHHDDDFLNHF